MEMLSTLSSSSSITASPKPLPFFSSLFFPNSNGLLLVPITRRNPRTPIVGFTAEKITRRLPICLNSFSREPISMDAGIVAPALPRLEDLDITNMLLRQRIVFISSSIDDASADFTISQLLLLDAEDSEKDIKIFIHSAGGSLPAGMGIYDVMKQCKADISTVCLGLAASTAVFILAAGTKGKRFCMPNSRVMILQPLGSSGSTLREHNIQWRELMYSIIKQRKILSRITGKTEEQIKEDTKVDMFMNAWEAKEYGLVDAVIDDGKPGLVAPIADASPPPAIKQQPLWDYELPGKKKLQPSERKFLKKLSSGDLKTEKEKVATENSGTSDLV